MFDVLKTATKNRRVPSERCWSVRFSFSLLLLFVSLFCFCINCLFVILSLDGTKESGKKKDKHRHGKW